MDTDTPPALPAEHPSSLDNADAPELPYTVAIKFDPQRFSEPWSFSDHDTFADFREDCRFRWPDYDWDLCKAIVSKPKLAPGLKALLKAQADDHLAMSLLHDNTLKLMAPKTDSLQSLKQASEHVKRRAQVRQAAAQRAQARAIALAPPRSGPRIRTLGDSDTEYTFRAIRPLPDLPRPERSQQFLERLASDAGIKATMRKHEFSVGLLTEMDPLSYTQSDHNGTTRILGLNRNHGQVIELRLRTDAYDGYRDYKTIRNTLCHELAHNVHVDHDRKFWDLCHQIEREVAAASSERTLAGDDEFAPARGGAEGEGQDMGMDHGGWFGGSFVLGGRQGTPSSSEAASAGGHDDTAGLTRREVMAAAAEKRKRDLEREAGRDRREDGNSRPS